MSTTETRITVADAIYAVERLLSWADSEDDRKPSTFALWLSLTGNLEGGALWAFDRGYLECSMLATALEAWATHPNDIRAWLADQCI
jgi:hypothetical protein